VRAKVSVGPSDGSGTAWKEHDGTRRAVPRVFRGFIEADGCTFFPPTCVEEREPDVRKVVPCA